MSDCRSTQFALIPRLLLLQTSVGRFEEEKRLTSVARHGTERSRIWKGESFYQRRARALFQQETGWMAGASSLEIRPCPLGTHALIPDMRRS